jgi:eukaryotic-like serine/threonine-protein kinase
MSSPSMQDVERAFHEARILSPAARGAWLRRMAEQDGELAAEVERLLESDAADSELDQTAWGPVETDRPGRVGPWILERRLASGGMGVVWLARRDDESFQQRAALKILSPLLADTAFESRFRTEGALLASLEHPGIARFLDGGVTDGHTALPYMAIEYVDGPAIDVYCGEHGLEARARVRLFLQVIDAVEAAHRALILHRDLKPANILVEGASGAVKVLDLGIAKLLGEGPEPFGRDPDLATSTGLFTPAYASPEQLHGRPVGTATDVFSLGVVLYELLAEQHPFPALGEGALEAALDRVQRTAPPLDPPDLATVVAKAMSPEPDARYASVRKFGEDLERWLDGRPVLARPVGRLERALKFARRNPALTVASSLALIGLVVAVGALSFGFGQARAARVEAQASAQVAQERRQALGLMLESLQTSFREDLRAHPSDLPVLRRLVIGAGRALEASEARPELMVGATVELADAMFRFGEPKAGEVALRRALEFEHQVSKRLAGQARLGLARVLAHTQRPDEAVAQLERIEQSLPSARRVGERVLLAEVWLERGILDAEAGELESARTYLERARKAARDLPENREGLRQKISAALDELGG